MSIPEIPAPGWNTSLETLRLTLAGVLLGSAIAGILGATSFEEIILALSGGFGVFWIRCRHIIITLLFKTDHLSRIKT